MLPLWWKMKFDTEATIPFWSGQVSSKIALGFILFTDDLINFPIAHKINPLACLLATGCYIEGTGSKIPLPLQADI
jgi:hypothetical protein